jgi:hypothetical protein
MRKDYRYASLTSAICTVCIATACFATASAGAQNGKAARPLFASNDIMRVQIEAPFATLMHNRGSDEHEDGVFRIFSSSGTTQTFDLKIRTRGHFRAETDHCEFAPLRLNFRKKQVKSTELEGQDILKLVTHCQNVGRPYEQSLLLEYMAYRILNQLTDFSFRVRLLRVEYIDTDRNNKSRTKYAFLIEDDKELSRRIGMQRAKLKSIEVEQLVASQAALVGVFQYLVGNTDFSAVLGVAERTCCHNVALFIEPGGQFIPIPYDFDFSGLVDAPYAAPNPRFNLKDVKERLYRGYCTHNHLLDAAIGATIEKRNDIVQLLQNQEGFTIVSRRDATRYIDSYYDDVSSQSSIERNLVSHCL